MPPPFPSDCRRSKVNASSDSETAVEERGRRWREDDDEVERWWRRPGAMRAVACGGEGVAATMCDGLAPTVVTIEVVLQHIPRHRY
jgi:hypothetical protein